MGKIFFKLKKNNKGVSLVEVLVTIAMVAIMAGPLLNSFLNAMGVNSKARQIQNGTVVGQDMVEKMEAMSLTEIESLYNSYKVVDTSNTGIIQYKSIPVTGPNEEKFEVDVTLDPNPYRLSNSDKEEVNEINLPGMSSLYGSDSIMLYQNYAAMDEQLKGLFGSNLPADIAGALMNPEHRQYLSKSTQIKIDCRYITSSDKYSYDITMTMTYTYDNPTLGVRESVSEVRRMQDYIFGADAMHNIYLVCPIFDLYYTGVTFGDTSYSTDAINIEYSFIGEEEKKKNVYFYLAEQEAVNLKNRDFKQRMNPNFVSVGNKSLSIYNSSETNVKLYTNVGVNTADRTKLTYIDRNTGIALYEMKVQVRLKGKSGVIAEFSSAK